MATVIAAVQKGWPVDVKGSAGRSVASARLSINGHTVASVSTDKGHQSRSDVRR